MRLTAALRAELSKLFRQRGTYASFAVILVLVGLLAWGSYHERNRLDVQRKLGSDFIVAGKSVTALFVSHTAMEVAMVVLMPLLVAVVLGGIVAGEAQSGTLRTLLARPVPRSVVLASKLITGWVYAISVTLFLGLSALGVGYLVFGWGDLVVFREGLVIFDARTGLVRLSEAYGLAAVAMCAIGTIGLMLSCIFDNPLVAAGLTVAFLLVCGTVEFMPYFERIKPYLFTTNLPMYQDCLRASVDTASISHSALLLLAYSAGAIVVSLWLFSRRDVTC
jgi:ABC-2 type transport system permease protein